MKHYLIKLQRRFTSQVIYSIFIGRAAVNLIESHRHGIEWIIGNVPKLFGKD